jgi:hypothetical protein
MKRVYVFSDEELCRVLYADLLTREEAKDENVALSVAAIATLPGKRGFRVELTVDPAAEKAA